MPGSNAAGKENIAPQPEYLGDGVYAGRTAWGDIEVFTSDGIARRNRIVFEPETWAALMRFAGRRAAESVKPR